MRRITHIVVHAADTPADMDIGAEEIRRWHVDDNGWSDIGYHYVLRRNGALEEGRPLERPGAHVRDHNDESIGICLVGGGGGDCNFTRAQWRALEALVGYLTGRFPTAAIVGHRDLDSGKQCPCFDVPAWWGEI